MTSLNQAYRRVATRAEAEAEDKSQAAPRATIHAFFPGAGNTLCGKHNAMETQSMGILRVVSCPECREELVKISKRNSRDGRAAAVEAGRKQATDRMVDEIKQTNVERDAATLNKLRACCGYVENGTDTVLQIYQDDATGGWIIKTGSRGAGNSFHADSFHEVIDTAYSVLKQEN